MPDKENILTASIDDYLLSLADGVCLAQRKLNQMVVPGQFGQPSVMYQLPKVEFELKMSFEMETGSSTLNTLLPGGNMRNMPKLRARPANMQSSGNSTSMDVASTIKGSLVATPAKGGKPPAVIQTFLSKGGSVDTVNIRVNISSAAGELLQDVAVQYNLDNELSRKLNGDYKREGSDDHEFEAGTKLTNGVVETNAEGISENRLQIDPNESTGVTVAVVIDALNERETILYTV